MNQTPQTHRYPFIQLTLAAFSLTLIFAAAAYYGARDDSHGEELELPLYHAHPYLVVPLHPPNEPDPDADGPYEQSYFELEPAPTIEEDMPLFVTPAPPTRLPPLPYRIPPLPPIRYIKRVHRAPATPKRPPAFSLGVVSNFSQIFNGV